MTRTQAQAVKMIESSNGAPVSSRVATQSLISRAQQHYLALEEDRLQSASFIPSKFVKSTECTTSNTKARTAPEKGALVSPTE